jgi:hypothetical protein
MFLTLRKNGKLSGKNLSAYLKKKPENSSQQNIWPRGLFIPM